MGEQEAVVATKAWALRHLADGACTHATCNTDARSRCNVNGGLMQVSAHVFRLSAPGSSRHALGKQVGRGTAETHVRSAPQCHLLSSALLQLLASASTLHSGIYPTVETLNSRVTV